MRKVVVDTLASVDGSVDHPGRYFRDPRELDGPAAPYFDEELVALETAMIARQDAILLGRRMFDEWAGYWPEVEDDPFAEFINRTRKYVITSTPLAAEWEASEAVTEPVGPWLRALKARPGDDIGVHGSIQLAQSLLREGLVDELVLVLGPTLDGTGRRLPAGLDAPLPLELISATPTSSGALRLVYRPGRPS